MTKQDQQRAERILDYIRETIDERGYPPSVREIAEAVGLASTSAVHHHLTKLEKDGRLQKEATRSRALTLPGSHGAKVVNAPIVGEIAAGQPIEAYEDRTETMALPAELAPKHDRLAIDEFLDAKAALDLPVGGVVVNLAHRAELDEEERDQALSGQLEGDALKADLEMVGVSTSRPLVEGLLEEAREHAERRVLEDKQRKRINGLDVPTYELSRLPDGIDLGGLYELAAELCRQGMA